MLLLLFTGTPTPTGTIVNRRPSENPGTVGTRSSDTRQGGL